MLPELQCLTQAALNLGYAYRTHDRNGNLLTVEIGERKYLFERNYTPFNTETEARICLDKEHCYQLLQGVVPMPKTLGFFDPKQAAQYNAYKHQASLDQVLDTLDREFRYPLIIKRNRGALASQVHWVQDAPEAGEALRQIFNQQSKEYDYVALAQEFIPTSREFRVVCFRGQLLLAYERFAGQRYFKAAYWQQPEGRSIPVDEPDLLAELQAFVQPVFARFPIAWVGIDLIQSTSGKWYLLELNSGPRFQHYIQHNGPETVVAMYQKLLSHL